MWARPGVAGGQAQTPVQSAIPVPDCETLPNSALMPIATSAPLSVLTQVIRRSKIQVVNHVEVMDYFGSVPLGPVATEETLSVEESVLALPLLAEENFLQAPHGQSFSNLSVFLHFL